MKTRDLLMRAMALFVASAFVFSCTPEEDITQTNDVPDEVLSIIADAGLSSDDVEKVNFKHPFTGEISEQYLIEGDIMMSKDEVAQLAIDKYIVHDIPGLPTEEQYRTYNLVGGLPRTLSVLGYTGSCCALTSKMRTALGWAVDNYNALNIGLSLTLNYGSANWQSYDMVVYNNGASGGGGSAGFPSGGDPHQLIQINAGTNSFSTNVNEHVITHEIGHCLGFRHTDYFNRSLSCGSGGNEGSGSIGAVHIPGTPTGTDYNSIMQACFNSGVSGEFGSYDVIALEYLY